ncbi:MAG: hypothetical protein M9899_09520 [Bdellovibrionaceae bacterium]|nr:hypothetical protein [Pseudobdellovibrionaceae bacterium]
MFKVVLCSLLMMLPVVSQAYLYASLKGHENDLLVDGRNVHVIVAGYGNELGMSTYQMAVSRAKRIKENFPNDRVLILGSTSFHEGTVHHKTTPERLEQDYDISIHRDFKDGGPQAHMITTPLTADNFTTATLYAIAKPSSLREFYRSSGPVTLTDVASAIKSGRIEGAGKIRSLDFITHSSPLDGIFLHNSTEYYKPISAQEATRAKAMGREVILEDGKYYVRENIAGTDKESKAQRSLTAASSQISALNGLFTDDAYVNMAGCSGGFGVVEDMSRALGVPVSGSANGAEVYVMDQNGDYYYNYPETNPNEGDSKPLSDSMNAMLGHELGANDDTAPPMGFKPAINMYNGYWGNLSSGTNFTITACVVREDQRASDLARCEMGMARRIEDALTASNSKGESFEIKEGMSREEIVAVSTAKYKNFLNSLKENMCPDGRGLNAYKERYAEVRNQCFAAINSLGVLSINCNVKSQELAQAKSASELEQKFPSKYKEVCTKHAEEYIQKYKSFVPLLDREGKTLVCDLNGCRVRLMGCEVTNQERYQCLSDLSKDYPQLSSATSDASCYATDGAPEQCLKRILGSSGEVYSGANAKLKRCFNSKRCEIDQDYTQASNKDNYTFMNYIQHYLSGYVKLEQYRRGDLKIEGDHPPVLPFTNASPSTQDHLNATGVR